MFQLCLSEELADVYRGYSFIAMHTVTVLCCYCQCRFSWVHKSGVC